MITTNLLEYFKDLRENYDNFKTIEGFVADPFWGDTDYIPDSFKKDGKISNPCYKYDPSKEHYYDQECVKNVLAESTSPQQTAVLKKVFNIDTPATTTPETTEQPVTTLTPVTTTPTTTPVVPNVVPDTTTADLCNGNILDFQCNKNLKILIWCLIIVCVLLVISFIIYIMYNSKQKENTTPVKELYTTPTIPYSPPPPKMKYQNNTNQREGFLKRMLGGKNRRKH